eukprot:gnl/Hemi2/26666_TR8953_c0_g1_i1.p1 gnl/Hemi2/26666_TR8953_c0_g1~~gnl/Hemi2/26666_TR8953_c0_g1_i1.p1  ORF type:complete len:114 (+),score=35.17 gnl/Hemi2/26666_TR8953_c0_g1_i1:64-405(+)
MDLGVRCEDLRRFEQQLQASHSHIAVNRKAQRYVLLVVLLWCTVCLAHALFRLEEPLSEEAGFFSGNFGTFFPLAVSGVVALLFFRTYKTTRHYEAKMCLAACSDEFLWPRTT